MVWSPPRYLVPLAVVALALPLTLRDARAVKPPDRPFVPVQQGFQGGAPNEAIYLEDHVLVQLTDAAFRASAIPVGARYGDPLLKAPLGLKAVDDAFAAAGATGYGRAIIDAANRREAVRIGLNRWLRVELDGSVDAAAVADRLARLPEVEAATPDYVAFPAAIPADPMHASHWGHNNTAQLLSYNWTNNNHETGSPVGTVGFDANAQAAWDGTQGFGSASIVIAIIDSGVQAGHPDLRQVTGWDYGDNDANPDDNSASAGHGTACAGVAAAINNSLGTAGIAAGCSIMPLKVANSAGTMAFSSIQNALVYAADHGAKVISMSLGAAIASDPATDSSILYAFNAGCTILAATGNENASTISYPAVNANVIGVGAASPCGERKRSSSLSTEVNPGVSTDPRGYTCDGERWWGSNYGTTTAGGAGAVDVIAPTILPTTDRLGAAGYDASDYSKWFNGTSCATPYAAGVCGLILSKNPTWTPAQVRTQLLTTAQDVVSAESVAGWDRYAGYGMVDAAAAVGGVAPPADAVTVTAPNGGESLTGGASFNITWTWTGSFTTVNIDYSSDGGTSWANVLTGTPNDGTQAWTVPSTATTQGRIRVSGGTASDISNANFTITVGGGGGTYATLPYSAGFEGGVFDAYWATAVTANGRVRLATTNTPHGGSYHMLMDDATSGGYSQTEARLRLNLAATPQVSLSFWWKDFGDETQTQDGIYFSSNGGTTFVKVYSLAPASFSDNTWRQVILDVDALAAANGVALTSTFMIKFQPYDDYPIATDGMAFDDISVTVPSTTPPITAESEPNETSGTADGPVGTNVAVTGSISTTTDVDYYYLDVSTAGNITVSVSIGSTADLDWFLYNSALTEVARGFSTANPEVGTYNAAAGRYYLKVSGYSGATSAYTLTITGGLANIIIPAQKPVGVAPLLPELMQNNPNPFHAATALRFVLPAPGRVSLQVFDLSGRLVSTLHDGDLSAGAHVLEWSGRDDAGVSAPAGIYFYRLSAPGFTETKKMLRVK